MEEIHVSIAPQVLGHLFGIPITNSLLMSWLAVLVLVTIALVGYRKVALIPGKFQSLVEILFGGIFDFIADTLESRDLAKRYFPLITTIFLFILIANWMEFIPGVESITYGHGEHVAPLFRSMNSDLNMTLALAIMSFFVIEISGILVIGFFKYFSRFFNTHSFVGFFVGIIELVSEVIRLISFSFRLFGNVFAGSVLIMVIMFFVPYVLPVPFMAFELFVGFMQAAIFSLLTLFFIKLAITEPAH